MAYFKEGSYVKHKGTIQKVVFGSLKQSDAAKQYRCFDSTKAIEKAAGSDTFSVISDGKVKRAIKDNDLLPYDISESLDEYNLGYLTGIIAAEEGLPMDLAINSMLVGTNERYQTGVNSAYSAMEHYGLIGIDEEELAQDIDLAEEEPIDEGTDTENLGDSVKPLIVDQPFHYELPETETQIQNNIPLGISAFSGTLLEKAFYKIAVDNSVCLKSLTYYADEDQANDAKGLSQAMFCEIGHTTVPGSGKNYVLIEGEYIEPGNLSYSVFGDCVRKINDREQYQRLTFDNPRQMNTFLQTNREYLPVGKTDEGIFEVALREDSVTHVPKLTDASEEVINITEVAPITGYAYFDGFDIVFGDDEATVKVGIQNGYYYGTYIEVEQNDEVNLVALPFDNYEDMDLDADDDEGRYTDYMTIWRINDVRPEELDVVDSLSDSKRIKDDGPSYPIKSWQKAATIERNPPYSTMDKDLWFYSVTNEVVNTGQQDVFVANVLKRYKQKTRR